MRRSKRARKVLDRFRDYECTTVPSEEVPDESDDVEISSSASESFRPDDETSSSTSRTNSHPVSDDEASLPKTIRRQCCHWNEENVDDYFTPGLINRNVTCYMNAVLQCIIHTPIVFHLVVEALRNDGDVHPVVRPGPGRTLSFNTTRALKDLVREIRESTGEILPSAFVDNLGPLSGGEFSGNDMEDAAECFNHIVTRMDSAMKKIFAGKQRTRTRC